MTTEEINKSNENPGVDKVMDFINTIEKDGYNIANFRIIRELTEKIARGNLEPIKNYNSLKELETKISGMEEHTTKFRFGVRDFLDKITNIVSKDSKFDYNENQFKSAVTKIKTKLGLIQAIDRVAEAEASRAKTKAAIDALDNNTSLTFEQKNQEFKRLLFIYNGANVEAIKNAKKIATVQEEKFNQNLDTNFIDSLGQDLKGIYDYLMMSNLSSDTKKTLIDEFNNILISRNEYKAAFNKNMSNLKLYKNTLEALGLSKNDKEPSKKVEPFKSTEKVTIPETPIFKINDTVVYKGHSYKGVGTFNNSTIGTNELVVGENYKIVDLEIINGLTYYKFENMGDNLYDASMFEIKELDQNIDFPEPVSNEKEENPNITQEEPNVDLPEKETKKVEEKDLPQPEEPEKPRGKKVINQEVKIGKGAIMARLLGVTYVTAAILVPALGPVALIPGILYAYTEYKNYALKKNQKNELTIMQRIFPFFKKKVIEKAEEPETMPEEKSEYRKIIEALNQNIEEEKEVSKTVEAVEAGIPDLDLDVKLVQETMANEGLTREESIEKILNTPVDPEVDSELKMGGI